MDFVNVKIAKECGFVTKRACVWLYDEHLPFRDFVDNCANLVAHKQDRIVRKFVDMTKKEFGAEIRDANQRDEEVAKVNREIKEAIVRQGKFSTPVKKVVDTDMDRIIRHGVRVPKTFDASVRSALNTHLKRGLVANTLEPADYTQYGVRVSDSIQTKMTDFYEAVTISEDPDDDHPQLPETATDEDLPAPPYHLGPTPGLGPGNLPGSTLGPTGSDDVHSTLSGARGSQSVSARLDAAPGPGNSICSSATSPNPVAGVDGLDRSNFAGQQRPKTRMWVSESGSGSWYAESGATESGGPSGANRDPNSGPHGPGVFDTLQQARQLGSASTLASDGYRLVGKDQVDLHLPKDVLAAGAFLRLPPIEWQKPSDQAPE
ncbi:hypothetical protein BDK51DRAFT_49301, partial [Blyttiomyces helicus]